MVFLRMLSGGPEEFKKTLSLICAAKSHHNIPGMHSSRLVVDVNQICVGDFWLWLGDVAMFSHVLTMDRDGQIHDQLFGGAFPQRNIRPQIECPP